MGIIGHPQPHDGRGGLLAKAGGKSAADGRATMVRIAIAQAAFDAITKTLLLGSVGYENTTNEKGERLIWLKPGVVDRLRAMRSPGQPCSDVILRLAEEG